MKTDAGSVEAGGGLGRRCPGNVYDLPLPFGEIPRELLAPGLPDAFAVSIEKPGGAAAPTDLILTATAKRKG